MAFLCLADVSLGHDSALCWDDQTWLERVESWQSQPGWDPRMFKGFLGKVTLSAQIGSKQSESHSYTV